MSELILWFAKSLAGSCELERSMFIGHPSGKEILCIRGKGGALRNVGTFQWTPGVKAVSAVFVMALARHLNQIDTFLPLLEGGKASLASSLDYALSKQPEWLFYMFGADETGNAYLRKLLFRTNSGFRRTGPIGISLREELLPAASISVYIDGAEIKDGKHLRHLAQNIVQSEQAGQQEALTADDSEVRTGESWSNSEEAFTIAPSIVADPDTVYLFEQLQYFGRQATRDRLLETCRYTVSPGHEQPEAIMGRMVQAKHLFEELDYATCSDAIRADFEKWIAQMTPELDGEYGLDRTLDGQIVPGFLTWIREHNQNEKFINSALYKTFIWRDRVSGEIVGTGTVAPDDRGVIDRYHLDGQGSLGGLNVRSDLRNRGVGKYVRARIDLHMAESARRRGRPLLIHAFSHTRGARSLGHGFQRNKISFVETSFGTLPLWSKMYTP